MESHNSYDVNTAWPITKVDDPKVLIKRLIELEPSGQKIGYRGLSGDLEYINSSLDRHFKDPRMSFEQRFKEETRLLKSFVKKAYPLLPPGGKQHIDLAKYRWNTTRNSGSLFVGRHYKLPTRCVDWTFNHLAALFFACQDNSNKSGVIWWMNYHQFFQTLTWQWPEISGKVSNVEDDLEKAFIRGIEYDVFTMLHYPKWMERPIKQDAWITLSGKYGVHHDEAIYRLGVRSCGRFIIKAKMKPKLLDMLERWGVNKKSLGLDNWLDTRIEKIAEEVAGKHKP